MAHEFKVGDRVRVIDHRPSDAHGYPNWAEGMDKTIGKEGLITAIMASGIIKVRFSYNEKTWLYKSSWVIPVVSDSKPETSISPFMPGDRVRVKPREWFDRQPTSAWRDGRVCILEHSCKEWLLGMELTVERYDKTDDTYMAGDYWWKAEWLEPVKLEVCPTLLAPLKAMDKTMAKVLGSFFPQDPQITAKLPLINSTKLLTHIKLD